MSRRSRKRRQSGLLRKAAAVLAGAAMGGAGLAGTAAAAQEDTVNASLDIVAVDSSGSPQVTLSVVPPDALAGVDVPAGAFTLEENGRPVEVQVVRAGEAAAGSTLEVVMVVDTSGSMEGEPMAAAKDAAAAFVDQMPEGTRVAVVAFGDRPTVVAPMSGYRGAAVAALSALDARGETALYDGLHAGLSLFSAGGSARQAMVVLSDGGDTASTHALADTTSALARSAVEFTAVELVTEEYDGSALRSLAGGAGLIVSADDPSQLAAQYEAVASDLLNRYEVTYDTLAGGATEVLLALSWDGVTDDVARTVRLPELDGPVAVTAPDATVGADPGWLGSKTTLYAGVGAFFLGALVLLGWLLGKPREVRVRMAHRSGNRMAAITDLAGRATRAADRRLHASGRESALYGALERAGIDLRPGEFVVLAVMAGVGGLAVGAFLAGPILGLVMGVVGVSVFPVLVRTKAKRRKAQFADQLADTLQLLTGSLRAGHSILQAMDSVASDAPSPTREEFQRLVVETRLGRDLPDALNAMHERVGNIDFQWFVQALAIHREVGGDLAEILDTVAGTIRERSRLRRQVRTLSAEGRLSAVILFVLPFGVVGLVTLMTPDYFSGLFGTPAGFAMIGAIVTLMSIGAFWLKKLIKLEF